MPRKLPIRSAKRDDPVYTEGWGTHTTLAELLRRLRREGLTASPEIQALIDKEREQGTSNRPRLGRPGFGRSLL